MDQRLSLGDVICFFDTETDSTNAYVAQAIDINLQFAKVGGTLESPFLEVMSDMEYDSLIMPKTPISEASVEWHSDKGGYTNEKLQNASNLRTVAAEAAAKVLAASNAAGHRAGERRVFMMGMNSNLYDMRLMQFGTIRITGDTWHGLLKDAGVCGVIDLMTLMKKPVITGMPTLVAAKINGKSNQGKIYKALFGEDLPDAHVAKSDVNGLVKIATESKEVMDVLLSTEVGSTLKSWKEHHDALERRNQYKKEEEEKLMRARSSSSVAIGTAAPTAAVGVVAPTEALVAPVVPSSQPRYPARMRQKSEKGSGQ